MLFMDMAAMPWALWVALGTIILGGVIAYGMFRTSRRTRLEKAVSDEGAKRIYAKEDARHHEPGVPD